MTTKYEADPQFGGAYRVQGYEGVAWRILGWQIQDLYVEYEDVCASCNGSGYDDDEDESCKKCEGNGKVYLQSDEPEEHRTGMIVARMVGDDRDFVLDQGDIRQLEREEYCGSCGQIGCTHDGLDRG